MKRTSIAVKSILACAIVALAASCGDNDSARNSAPANDSITATPAGCRIAYFDADSVMRAYTLAQQLTEEGQRLMNRFQQQAAQKQRELEAQAANIERKRQNNAYLSEASFQHDVEVLQRAQADAERQLNAQQTQIQATIAQSQQRLNDSINNCVTSLNASLGYDAILFRESGVYFNPELDITNAIIAALNERMAGSAAAAQ
ncbi:MAG: OmpH family outer membrane protein [Muribaculaceae bacterium]|nr:OmpH family outer membrane protein [Muribaculaceae bacterium]